MTRDIAQIRADFPVLGEKIHGKPLVYFDNAATTQKPQVVIDKIAEVYQTYNGNIHRGVHHFSQLSSIAYENARKTVARFVGAEKAEEIIFTRGTTESINLVAHAFGELMQQGDEVIITTMEHHANIVPWQLLAKRKGIVLRVLGINEKGELQIDELQHLINEKTRLLSVTAMSNTLGTINPMQELVSLCHARGVKVMLDAAQAVAHMPIDVTELDVDFLAFSGHKIYAPVGIGVLYGKKELLDRMEPYEGGGGMIEKVSFEGTTFNELPYKFEAGTPNYVGAIALAEAINYIEHIGMHSIATYEDELLQYALTQLSQIEGIRFIGEPKHRGSVISFLIGNIHPFDMGTLLDKMGIAIRTGHHCAHPVMDAYGISGTLRVSFAFYNTHDEIDYFIASLQKAQQMLG